MSDFKLWWWRKKWGHKVLKRYKCRYLLQIINFEAGSVYTEVDVSHLATTGVASYVVYSDEEPEDELDKKMDGALLVIPDAILEQVQTKEGDTFWEWR